MLGCECSKLLLHKCAFIYPSGSAPSGSTLATLIVGVGGQKALLGVLDVRLFIQYRYHCKTSGGQREMGGGRRLHLGFWMCVYLSNTGNTVKGQGGNGRSAGQLYHVNKNYSLFRNNNMKGNDGTRRYNNRSKGKIQQQQEQQWPC